MTVYTHFNSKSQWKRLHLYITTVVVGMVTVGLLASIGLVCFQVLTSTTDLSWNKVFNNLELVFISIGGSFFLWRYWYKEVFVHFKKIQIMEFDQSAITYFWSPDFIIERRIGFSHVTAAIRRSVYEMELEFNEVLHTYEMQTKHGPVKIEITKLLISGDEKGVNSLEQAISVFGLTVQQYPMGKAFDIYRERGILFLGLAVIAALFIGFIILLPK